jgi:predicted Zn-dependent peptidase
MLDVALALAFAPDHPQDEIEREKGVVRQEIGEAADQPDDLVFELAQVASYPGHPLGRPILGTEQTLETITRDDLVGFGANNYSPQRTVVSVAGAFDRQAVLSVVDRWLASRKGDPAPMSAAPVAGVAALRAEQRKLEQSHIVLARRTVSATSPDRFAARIFAEIFGGGMASRLFQDVREARGLAYTIDASCDQHADCGRISVYAGSDPKDAAEVVKITKDIWADLATAGPTEAEMARAKAVAAAQFAMSAEAPAARAGSAAYELLTFDRLVSVEEVLGHIGAVTTADVRRVAAETLANPGIASAVGPKAGLAAAEAFVSA